MNIVDSMFFDGVASAALVEAAAIGSMLISPMIKQDDDREFTTAVTPLSSLERGRE